MNFFGHAAVAARYSTEPAFVLGAMLPDFASMAGVRLPDVRHPALASGVRFHHLTDRVFHELPAFRALTGKALVELRARGVERGPARAVAHVGVEMLLDAELGQSAAARSSYLGALAAAGPGLVASLAWPEAHAARLTALLEVLASRGVVLDVSSATLVERVKRTLSSRPRLALDDGAAARVLAWLEATRGRVVASLPALVSGLHVELERRFST